MYKPSYWEIQLCNPVSENSTCVFAKLTRLDRASSTANFARDNLCDMHWFVPRKRSSLGDMDATCIYVGNLSK